jgi:hypothetical protein
MTSIRTARLSLEPVTTENAVVLWRIMQGAQLREFQDVPRFTRQEFEKRVAVRPKSFDGRAIGRFEWLIVSAETQVASGWISLRVGDQTRGSAELGYSILAPERRRNGAIVRGRPVDILVFELKRERWHDLRGAQAGSANSIVMPASAKTK